MFQDIKLIKSQRQLPSLKKLLTRAYIARAKSFFRLGGCLSLS